MKRKTDKDVVCEHKGVIVLFTIPILIGLLVCLIPLLPKPEYHSIDKMIHVDRVEYDSGVFSKSSSGDFTRLIDSDGEVFIIGNRDGAYETAFTGADLTIQYHEAHVFFKRENIVDKVTWSGGSFMTHGDSDNGHWYVAVIAGVVIILIGACGLFMIHMDVKRNRKMQKARDQRLIKKYGDKAKVK